VLNSCVITRVSPRVTSDTVKAKMEKIIREDIVLTQEKQPVKLCLEGRSFSCCIHSDLPCKSEAHGTSGQFVLISGHSCIRNLQGSSGCDSGVLWSKVGIDLANYIPSEMSIAARSLTPADRIIGYWVNVELCEDVTTACGNGVCILESRSRPVQLRLRSGYP